MNVASCESCGARAACLGLEPICLASPTLEIAITSPMVERQAICCAVHLHYNLCHCGPRKSLVLQNFSIHWLPLFAAKSRKQPLHTCCFRESTLKSTQSLLGLPWASLSTMVGGQLPTQNIIIISLGCMEKKRQAGLMGSERTQSPLVGDPTIFMSPNLSCRDLKVSISHLLQWKVA